MSETRLPLIHNHDNRSKRVGFWQAPSVTMDGLVLPPHPPASDSTSQFLASKTNLCPRPNDPFDCRHLRRYLSLQSHEPQAMASGKGIGQVRGTWGYYGAHEELSFAPSQNVHPSPPQTGNGEANSAPKTFRILKKDRSPDDRPTMYDPKEAKQSVPTGPKSERPQKAPGHKTRKRPKGSRNRPEPSDKSFIATKSKPAPKILSFKCPPVKHDSEPRAIQPCSLLTKMTSSSILSSNPTVKPAAAASDPASRFTGPFRLMDLPREIRLIIYDDLINGAFVKMDSLQAYGRFTRFLEPCGVELNQGIEYRTFPSLPRNNLMKWEESSFLHGQRLDFIDRSSPSRDRKNAKAELMFVCKTFAREIAPLLYSRSIFAFASKKHLAKFVNTFRTAEEAELMRKAQAAINSPTETPAYLRVSPVLDLVASIKHLCLEIRAYGEPAACRYRGSIFKYYDGWQSTCRRVVERLPNLSDVAISVHVPYIIDFNASILCLKSCWAQPLLEFARPDRLRSVAVTLLLPRCGGLGMCKETGSAFAEVLNRKMMGWPDDVALEAIADWKLHKKPSDGKGWSKDMQERWALVELANGMEPIGEDVPVGNMA